MRAPLYVVLALAACSFTPGRLGQDPLDDGAVSDQSIAVTDGRGDGGATRVTAGLVALYTFEEGGGADVLDRSGVGAALDLVIAEPANTAWGSGTLTVTSETLIASPGAATKVLDACRAADAFTIEAWITPALIGGYFPRVVTLSLSNDDLVATLMAIDSHFEFRMRGPMTDGNGLPSLDSPANTVVVAPLHVVLVSEPGGARRIVVDGAVAASDTRGGDLASWGTGYRLGLANEIDRGRPWLGTFDLVAVYARALTDADIAQNRAAGPL